MGKHDNYRVKQTVRKVEAGNYEVYAGDVLIGRVHMDGQHGYDNYPWSWSLELSEDSLRLAAEGTPPTTAFSFQGQADTKRDCLDSMWHRAGLA